jgi:hypothetical protein
VTLSGGFTNFALSLAMVAAFALAIAGVMLIVKKQDRQRGLLMIGVSAVLIANVLIWVWPVGH